jgi:prepilin-type N-terminal cleavage/methylation domain-containing protein
MRADAGYTLVEVVAAVALAAIVVETSARLLDQIGDQGRRIRRDAVAVTDAGVARRRLDDALAHATTSSDTSRGFRGDEHFMELDSRCATSAGWSLPCRTAILIDTVRDSSIIYARDNDGPAAAVRRQRGAAFFLYRDLARPESSWAHGWRGAATLPAAIAIGSAHDTIVIPVGAARD